MNDRTSIGIDRVILVANDDAGDAPISLPVEIAEAFQAELNGLFIRDQRLRDLVASPFAQAFVSVGGSKRPLSLQAIERAWGRNENRFRKAVMSGSARRKVSCSFRSAEGAFDACLLEGVDHRDLIALVLDSRSTASGSQVGVVRGVAKYAHSILLMSRTSHTREARRRAPIVFLDTDNEDRRRQMYDMALRLSRATGRPLIVFSATDAAVPGSGHESVPGQPQVTVRNVDGHSAENVTDVAMRLAPALIIADVHRDRANGDKSEDDLLSILLKQISAPLLLLAAE